MSERAHVSWTCLGYFSFCPNISFDRKRTTGNKNAERPIFHWLNSLLTKILYQGRFSWIPSLIPNRRLASRHFYLGHDHDWWWVVKNLWCFVIFQFSFKPYFSVASFAVWGLARWWWWRQKPPISKPLETIAKSIKFEQKCIIFRI